MDIVLGIIAIGLPILFVAAIAWHESVLTHWLVYIGFTILATIFVVRYIGNLSDWQLGLFGLLFALAIIGISYLFGGKKT